jgi:hypothetical protein
MTFARRYDAKRCRGKCLFWRAAKLRVVLVLP